MASRHLVNQAVGDPSRLRSPKNQRQQLLSSLDKLTAEYPPQAEYAAHELRGLYSGPTSVAYLFLLLEYDHHDIVIDGVKPLAWAEDYLHGVRERPGATADHNGIINEDLAYYAVKAAVDKDVKSVEQLVKSVRKVTLGPEKGSDEWLYGRAGCLYLLRLARHRVPDSLGIINPMTQELVERILSSGPSWPWHGKDYLGAVHGRIGIITQIVLTDPYKASHPVLLESLNECLKFQTEDGNWPSSKESGHSHLIQFCHGAPGFIISFKAIKRYFPAELQERIHIACALAEKCIFEKGLLRKEPNLCHGTMGNALALPAQQRKHFMALTSAAMIDIGLGEGSYFKSDDPYGLFCGEAGRAWSWSLLLADSDKGMIGYTDV